MVSRFFDLQHPVMLGSAEGKSISNAANLTKRF